MLAVLFGMAVLLSLGTTAAIGLDVLPASPTVMAVCLWPMRSSLLGSLGGTGAIVRFIGSCTKGVARLYELAVTHAIERASFVIP